MKIKNKFIFNIKDKVKIKELDIKGRVCGIYLSEDEISYQIRYIYNGDPKTVYFYDDKLELIDDKLKSVGFKEK
jgi:hypothetical protein